MNEYQVFLFTQPINKALFNCCGFNRVRLELTIKLHALNSRSILAVFAKIE